MVMTHTTSTVVYTLSLHDALPISEGIGIGVGLRGIRDGHAVVAGVADAVGIGVHLARIGDGGAVVAGVAVPVDRKSTRLNSSHVSISYAVFCLKKKKKHSIRIADI